MTPYEALASGAPSLAEQLDEGAHRLLDAARARAGRPARRARRRVDRALGPGPPRPSCGSRRAPCASSSAARRRAGLERILLGSVVLPVVAHAHCPVVVVPAGTAVETPRRIVVGVDGSEASGRAVGGRAGDRRGVRGERHMRARAARRGARGRGRHRTLQRPLGRRGAAVPRPRSPHPRPGRREPSVGRRHRRGAPRRPGDRCPRGRRRARRRPRRRGQQGGWAASVGSCSAR